MRTKHKTSFYLINRNTYKGIGRPRREDYIYLNTFNELIVAIIGEPINPSLPVPTVVESISSIITKKA